MAEDQHENDEFLDYQIDESFRHPKKGKFDSKDQSFTSEDNNARARVLGSKEDLSSLLYKAYEKFRDEPEELGGIEWDVNDATIQETVDSVLQSEEFSQFRESGEALQYGVEFVEDVDTGAKGVSVIIETQNGDIKAMKPDMISSVINPLKKVS